MIEKVIEEIRAAEAAAAETIARANERAAELSMSANAKVEEIKNEYAARYRKEADKMRAAAEEKGERESAELMKKAVAAAESELECAKANYDAAADYIIAQLVK